jgi:hypothetical protein
VCLLCVHISIYIYEDVLIQKNKMAAASTQVFYIVQGEPGEDMAHPNVFTLPSSTPGLSKKKLKLKSIIEHFPLRGTGKFHFRFKLAASKPSNGFNWVDISDPEGFVPFYKGMLLAKTLRLDRPFYSGKQRSKHDWTHDASESVGRRSSPRVHTASTTAPSRAGGEAQKPKESVRKRTKAKTSKGKKNVAKEVEKPRRPSGNMIQFENFQGASSSNAAGRGSTSDMMMGFDTLSTPTVESNVKVTTREVSTEGMSQEVAAAIQKRKAAEQKRINDAQIQHLQNLEQEQQGQVDRDNVKKELHAKLLAWSGDINQGTLKNIRALLTTMHNVLWDDCNWKALTLADCVQGGKVKRNYYKAIRLVHPDRSQKAPPKQKYISEQIFTALNAAWDKYVATERG